MPYIRADRVMETSTTTGTGALTLAGAVAGFRTFASVAAVADTVHYVIELVNAEGAPTGEWETGLGTYSGVNTLTRTTPIASSNGGAAVNFSAGTKRVAISNIEAATVSTQGDTISGALTLPSGTSISAGGDLTIGAGAAVSVGGSVSIGSDRVVTVAVFTVAGLPAAGTVGRIAAVTDALAPTFLATVVGGGAIKTPVFDDGTNWVVG